MSAAVPTAELASYFGERDVWYWRHHMGRLCDPLAPVDLYAIEHDKESGCHLADRHLAVPVCIYVVVDDAGACLYIGQCRRPGGSVVQRIGGHHAIPPSRSRSAAAAAPPPTRCPSSSTIPSRTAAMASWRTL